MKRIGMFLAVAILVGTAWTPTANAEPIFFKVNVELVGMVSPTILEFRLSDILPGGTFTNKRFQDSSDIVREDLAIALTAFALDSPMWVLTDPAIGAVPEILLLFIAK